MMTAGDVVIWSAMILAGIALLLAIAVAYLAILRWLIVIVPLIVLVGFAFEPDMQLRFTAVLLGALAILYLPPLLLAWVWRQVAGQRPFVSARTNPPSTLETVHQTFADEMARHRADRQIKTASTARDRDDRDDRARDLERQGMLSLWTRR
jgi:hypothetical protein